MVTEILKYFKHVPDLDISLRAACITGPHAEFVSFVTDIDSGAADVVRVLLERLTDQTQQLQ